MKVPGRGNHKFEDPGAVKHIDLSAELLIVARMEKRQNSISDVSEMPSDTQEPCCGWWNAEPGA
jgi:hypothetical protein